MTRALNPLLATLTLASCGDASTPLAEVTGSEDIKTADVRAELPPLGVDAPEPGSCPIGRPLLDTPRLTVAGRRMLDALGREVLLRGMNAGGRSKIPVRMDDPASEIAGLVARGFMVRTRADAGHVLDPTRREQAFASGAHFVSTDFPAPVEGQDYWVDVPSGVPSRCNPVAAPPECTAELVEYL